MSIFLSKNAQHKVEQQKEAERNRQLANFQRLSEALVKWCREEDLSIMEFKTVTELTLARFNLAFDKTRINRLTNDGKIDDSAAKK